MTDPTNVLELAAMRYAEARARYLMTQAMQNGPVAEAAAARAQVAMTIAAADLNAARALAVELAIAKQNAG